MDYMFIIRVICFEVHPKCQTKKLTFGGVFFMSKYSYEFKLKVINDMLDNHVGTDRAAKKYGISRENLRRWFKRYELYGIEGLLMKKGSYDGKFKQNVVEYMHNNHLSCSETALRFGIPQDATVGRWERIYYEEGPQALYEDRRGKIKNMSSKPRKKKLSKEVEEDLIAENQRLRMENEYLKKLNALVQERIKRESKKK